MTGPSPKILIVGAGGIGGTIAAHLHEVEADVTTFTTNPEIARAVRSNGFRIRSEGELRTVRGQIATEIPSGPYDFILIATQPPQVEEAARMAVPHLSVTGRMVCFQNGLCEVRVARISHPDQVIGGIVTWGASMVEPGVYDRTSAGGFVLGRLSGPLDGSVRALGEVLEAVGPVDFTENLAGARWSKLALNCAISSLGTIAGERLGPLVGVRRYRRLALDIFTEVVEVARAEKITLEKVAGTIDLDWIALSEADRKRAVSASLTTKHALLLAVGLRYRRLRSSMLSAIERGRAPAIDFLNGEIVSRGRTHAIPVPVNALVVDTVHAIASGRARFGRDLLDEIYERTR
jgi:2-dehydropantoate 2-reductase